MGIRNDIFLKGKIDIKKTIISLLIVAILEAIAFYMMLPAFNIFSEGFWVFQGVFIIIFLVTTIALPDGSYTSVKYNLLTKIIGAVIVLGIVVFVVGHICSATIFSAKRYASLIEVEDKNFQDDIVESDTVNDIALMDTESAKSVGKRAIGSLSDLVSQYEISENYSTVDVNGVPKKVASLEYAGFFKWLNNKSDGIPGYVIVDPVKFEAEYVKLDKSIKYTPSGWFNHNLQRHLRFKYPTAIFEGYYFEIDNEGNPFYICPIMKPRVGMFGGYDVNGVVICDPTTGDCKYYSNGDVPNWVDRVYDGDLVIRKYNWKGILSGGYWNSMIGQKGCKMATADYGYKVVDGDVWVYTGVTSVIGDESNIGFVMINSRTCETKYYTVAGAEEFSAMDAAEGQVQHLGYIASFPSLINIDGQPTYFMVLKDKSNLVKMYAMVNVTKYSIVATGTTQKDTLDSYKRLLQSNSILDGDDESEERLTKNIVVKAIEYINVSGDTYAYITDKDGSVYKQLFSENESLIFIQTDDELTITYEKGIDGIDLLKSYNYSDARNENIENQETGEPQ